MNEDLLHYLWKYRLFDHAHLQTTEGEPIKIEHPGQHNTHAGPDFENARVYIGATLWAGSVEIHLKSSDWMRHKHQHDAAYNNVVLHVVLEHDDVDAVLESGAPSPPVLQLKGRLPVEVVSRYRQFLASRNTIPCAHQIDAVEPIIVESWLARLLAERLETKALAMRESLNKYRGDWEQTLHVHLFRIVGFKTNADPMEHLAMLLPAQLVRKYSTNELQLEALLFGVAGFLETPATDSYPQLLASEFRFLRTKHKLQIMNPAAWKFLRMRPRNFPTIRIAQLATLLHQSPDLFAVMRDLEEAELINRFQIEASGYWETHFRFDVAGEASVKRLGDASINLLLINVVAPMLFLYGKEQANQAQCDRAIRLLERLPAESNSIIKSWKELGLKPSSAGQSQALLQLRNNYCSAKKCLSCSIGSTLLKKPIVHD